MGRNQCSKWVKRWYVGAVMMAVVGAVGMAQGAGLEVVGPPAYDPVTKTGYKGYGMYNESINSSGMAVGVATKYVNGVFQGYFVDRWDGSTGANTELGYFGTGNDIINVAISGAINENGMVAGTYAKYVGGIDKGSRPARWDAGSATPTELDVLGTDASGYTMADARCINATGTTVGGVTKYVDGISKGMRTVRWEAGQTTATELAVLGTDAGGYAAAVPVVINAAGTIAGYARKYSNGVNMGGRAVRWDAGGTAITELDNLGTRLDGFTVSTVYGMNDAGTVVGTCSNHVNGVDQGICAVRWEAGGTAITELGGLNKVTSSITTAYAINAAGTTVGSGGKVIDGVYKGQRGIRWNAGSTVAIELGNLGTALDGTTNAYAHSINSAGIAAGYATKFVNGVSYGDRATIWLPDASVIDLNDLVIQSDPAGGTWVLTKTDTIKDNGWVAGEGTFDPDGTGPLGSYNRLWVAQVGLGGNWLNTTSTNNTWGKGDNWSTGTPAIQRDAVFNANASYSVVLDADQGCRKVDVTAGQVTLVMAGRTLTVEQGVTIGSGGKLAANGTIKGDVRNDGILAPGNSPGSETIIGNYTQTGTLELDINSVLVLDKLTVNGKVDLNGVIKVILNGGDKPTLTSTYDLLDWNNTLTHGQVSFDFSQAPLDAGLVWDTSTFFSDGILRVDVPEPGSLGLLVLGVGGLLWRRRR